MKLSPLRGKNEDAPAGTHPGRGALLPAALGRRVEIFLFLLPIFKKHL